MYDQCSWLTTKSFKIFEVKCFLTVRSCAFRIRPHACVNWYLDIARPSHAVTVPSSNGVQVCFSRGLLCLCSSWDAEHSWKKCDGMAVLVFLLPVCVWCSLTHAVLDPHSAVPGSEDARKFILQNEVRFPEYKVPCKRREPWDLLSCGPSPSPISGFLLWYIFFILFCYFISNEFCVTIHILKYSMLLLCN